MNLLYIDPGTGSMLFSIIIGVVTTLVFAGRKLYMKLKFVISGGKTSKIADAKVPYVIFSDHKRYWNVFKPICDEFERRGVDLIFWTASPDDPALSEKYEHVKCEFIGEGNKAFARLNMMNADIVIATTPNLDVYQWKRSKYVNCYVHVPHTVDDLSGYRMFGLDFYDSVLATGKNQLDFLKEIESLRPSINKKEIITVGSLTLDNLKKRYDAVSSKVENPVPVVLIAPSWGPSGILTKYGEKLLSALSKTDYKIIVRPHPQTVVSEKNILEPLTKKFSNIEWNYDNDNFEVLNKSDVLITDFSGIIFDYTLVFNKTIIYADTDFDTSLYDAAWLPEKMWSLRAVEKLGIKLNEDDFDKISSVIQEAINSKNLQSARDEIRNECWQHIGKSAELITDWLISKQQEISVGGKECKH